MREEGKKQTRSVTMLSLLIFFLLFFRLLWCANVTHFVWMCKFAGLKLKQEHPPSSRSLEGGEGKEVKVELDMKHERIKSTHEQFGTDTF